MDANTISQLPCPLWEDADGHYVLHKAHSFTVGVGTTPPNTACPMHYHARPTCIINTRDTSRITILEYQPPHYCSSNPKRVDCVFAQGDCFTQAFQNTVVHSYVLTEIPGAFVAVETNFPVLDRDPSFSHIRGHGTEVVRKQSHCFWSSQLLRIEPGATATVGERCEEQKSEARRLAVIISRLKDPLNKLVVDGSSRIVQSYSHSMSGIEFEVVIVEEIDNAYGVLNIINQGAKCWVGMLVEIFGKENA
ncbi:unnamed protein product [Agarophyton chilense]